MGNKGKFPVDLAPKNDTEKADLFGLWQQYNEDISKVEAIPTYPNIKSVNVDKKDTLAIAEQIAVSRYTVKSQADPIMSSNIKYITDKYLDEERFRKRYVHHIK